MADRFGGIRDGVDVDGVHGVNTAAAFHLGKDGLVAAG